MIKIQLTLRVADRDDVAFFISHLSEWLSAAPGCREVRELSTEEETNPSTKRKDSPAD